jgi:CheY-like chemotaxis protein
VGKVRTSILIVDKDPRTRALVEAAVDPGRVSIEVVGDVRAGWEAAKSTLPGLIVVDADLPKGWNLCTELKRKSKRLRQVPLVLLSAKADDDIFHNHQSLPSRADAYLSKPLDDVRFKTTVDLLLEYTSGSDEDDSEAEGANDDEDLELEFEIDMDDLLDADDDSDEAERPATSHASSLTPVPSALDAAAMGEIDRMRKRIAELEIQLAEQRRSEGDRMREQAREGFQRLQALRDELEAAKRDADERRKAEDTKPETKPDDGALAELRARNAALEGDLETLRTAGQGLEETSTLAARELEGLRRQVEALEAERDALADRARAEGEQAGAADALKARAKEAEAARERLAEALEVVTTRVDEADKAAEAAEAARGAAEKKAAEAEKRAAEAEKKAAEAETNVAEAEERAVVAEKNATDAEKKAADAEKNATDAERKAADAEKNATDAERKAADAQKNAVDAERKAADAERKAADAEKRAERLEKAAAANAEELQQALASVGEHGDALAEVKAERDTALARAEASDEALAKATEGLKAAEAASAALADELVSVRERVTELSADREAVAAKAKALAEELEDAEERAGELLAGRDTAVDRAEAAAGAEAEARAALAEAGAKIEELESAHGEQAEQLAQLQQELADAVARGKALRDYATELEALHKTAEERNATEQALAAEVDSTLRAALAGAMAKTEAAEREATTSTEAARAALSGVRKLAKSLTNLAADATKLGELEPGPRPETKAGPAPELPAPPTYAPAEPLPEAPKLSIIVGTAVPNAASLAVSTKRLANAKGRGANAKEDAASSDDTAEPLIGLDGEPLEDEPEIGSQTMVFEMPPSSFDQIEAEVLQPPPLPLPPSLPPDAGDEALAELDSLDPRADLGSRKRPAPPRERVTDVDDWENLEVPD